MNRIFRRFSSKARGSSWMCTNPYDATSTIQLILPYPGTTTTVRVAKAFTPFASSQALLVNTTTPIDFLPKQFILKLADRRFGKRSSPNPWTPTIENEFQLYMTRHVAEHGTFPIVDPDREIMTNLPAGRDKDEKPPVWLTELSIELYRHLEEAQHLGLVPRFYGQTVIPMSSETAPDHPAFQAVSGLLLEYIPGETLHSFLIRKDRVIPKKQREEVFHKVIALAQQMRSYGAIHNDLHFANIILRERDRTPVIIDWGPADIEMVDSPRLADFWSESDMWPDFEEEIRQYLGKDDTKSSRWYRDSSLTPNEKAVWDHYAREFAKRSLSSWKRERIRKMGGGQRNGGNV